jgi:dinuclear metal center YbgI/SA1388 family protein
MESTPHGLDRDRLVHYLDQYLEVSAVEDLGPNGLQVEGARTIRKIVTGVSGCLELFTEARQRAAQAVLVHHGTFWEGMPRTLTGWQYRRVAELVRSEINLIAYHLPLDRHPKVGNNAVAARELGLLNLEPFALYKGVHIGFKGEFSEPLDAEDLIQRATALYGRAPLALGPTGGTVQTVGVVSGGAQSEIHQAIAAGLDAYITGEASEWVMNIAREAGIHFLSCGHYATERIGIQALGQHLHEEFGLEIEFVDIENPV